MDLLKVLAMPFQLSSLLFVAMTSFVLGIVLGSGNFVTWLIGMLGVLIILTWLTRYAFGLIDDVANGVRETAAAKVEMASPFGDARCLVHPALTAALLILYAVKPELPVMPALLGVAVLFPASIAACAMSGHARDALNPMAIGRVIIGMGFWYVVAVLAMVACAVLGVLITRGLLSAWEPLTFGGMGIGWLLIASLELLLLVACAVLGGLVFQRREELGFAARISPERRAEAEHAQRNLDRQKLFDHLYTYLRSRDVASAIAETGQWLRGADPGQVYADVRELAAAGRQWNVPREFTRFVRELLPQLMRQPAAAQLAADAALAADPRFAPASEPEVVTLVEYALQTGRRRGATQLLENFIAAAQAAPGPRLQALRTRLQPAAPAP